jgi:hypothetical protein
MGSSKQPHYLAIGLFVLTFIATTLAGAEWMNSGSFLARHILVLLARTTSDIPEEEVTKFLQES